MKTINEHIIAALEEKGLKYEIIADEVISVTIGTDVGVAHTAFITNEEKNFFWIRAQGPCHIPEEKREKVYPLLNSINEGRLFGTIFVDQDGDIVLTYACNVDDGAINTTIILAPWAALLKNIEETYDEIMRAAYAD